MKKLFLTTVILSLLIPASLFAGSPSDQEVQDTTIAVLSLFGMVFMSSMFGTTPENVTVDTDMETGESSMVFDQFDVNTFVASMSEMMAQSPEEERPVFLFTTLSGSIDVTEGGNLMMDVDLKGGNIKNLKIETSGEDLVSLKANGKSYNHLNQIFQGME